MRGFNFSQETPLDKLDIDININHCYYCCLHGLKTLTVSVRLLTSLGQWSYQHYTNTKHYTIHLDFVQETKFYIATFTAFSSSSHGHWLARPNVCHLLVMQIIHLLLRLIHLNFLKLLKVVTLM